MVSNNTITTEAASKREYEDISCISLDDDTDSTTIDDWQDHWASEILKNPPSNKRPCLVSSSSDSYIADVAKSFQNDGADMDIFPPEIPSSMPLPLVRSVSNTEFEEKEEATAVLLEEEFQPGNWHVVSTK